MNDYVFSFYIPGEHGMRNYRAKNMPSASAAIADFDTAHPGANFQGMRKIEK